MSQISTIAKSTLLSTSQITLNAHCTNTVLDAAEGETLVGPDQQPTGPERCLTTPGRSPARSPGFAHQSFLNSYSLALLLGFLLPH